MGKIKYKIDGRELNLKICVYPGSFDPVTNGHLDIIHRSAMLCDRLVVAVGNNINKKYCFNLEERVGLLKMVLDNSPGIEVESFSGLLVDFMKKKKARVIIKGLRAVSDFEYEFQMALLNRKLQPDIETIFMMTNYKYSYLSSSMVKEIAALEGSIVDLVPETIRQDIINKLCTKSGGDSEI